MDVITIESSSDDESLPSNNNNHDKCEVFTNEKNVPQFDDEVKKIIGGLGSLGVVRDRCRV